MPNNKGSATKLLSAGEIKGYQAASGTIIVTENEPARQAEKVAIYARVSSAEQKANLERQKGNFHHEIEFLICPPLPLVLPCPSR